MVRIQLQTANAKWFREFLAHDPATTLGGLTTPVLAITGGKDIQMDPDDVGRIGKLVAGPFEGHVPPMWAKRPIDTELVELVVDWLARVTA